MGWRYIKGEIRAFGPYFPTLVLSNEVIGTKMGLKHPENGLPGA